MPTKKVIGSIPSGPTAPPRGAWDFDFVELHGQGLVRSILYPLIGSCRSRRPGVLNLFPQEELLGAATQNPFEILV